MEFALPKEQPSIIKVIGVGGGGSNAVSHMYAQGINGVDFIICNTDQQSLSKSPVPNKIPLGESLTQGLGAGSLPEIGKNSAIESIDQVKEMIGYDTKMVFITAGMGGGTGTGAAPVIAAAAKEMGILTVGIVTIPFVFEGKKRKIQAEEGLEALRNSVDTMIIINNDKLREMYGNLSLKDAFAHADNVLTTAAKGIAEVITVPGYVNVDFNDVSTVMTNGGTAIMGHALAEGDDRAIRAVEQALASPLLNDNNIKGASQVLLYISSGTKEVTMDEVGEISDYIQEEAGSTANIIFGVSFDETLGENIRAIVIATGFSATKDFGTDMMKKPEKTVYKLNTDVKSEVEKPLFIVQNPVTENTEVKAPIIQAIQQDKPTEPEMYLKNTQSEEQVSIEFVVPNHEQKIVHVLDEKADDENAEIFSKKEEAIQLEFKSEKKSDTPTADEQMNKAQERVNRLKELTFRNFSRPGNITGMENEPAYKRRNIHLDNVPHSSQSQVSRYTLSENEEKKTEIKPNNSFLHDNVD
ncbi:MAG: cell division protein FtsZ [Bacteroidetes bacterium]|nr:cell division protein FtsZ [Bacteroidota bacterium]HET6245589.1 cell division protein FtsZ [Bacteroidia bacterium]